MFDAICFRDGATLEGKIDFGFMAEALIFYGKIHFISNHSAFRGLLERVGAFEVLELLKAGYLEIHVSPDQVVAMTNGGGSGLERHDFAFVELVDYDPKAEARKVFLECAGGVGHRAAANDFVRRLHFISAKKLALTAIRDEVIAEPTFGLVAIRWLRTLAHDALPTDPYIRAWHLGTEFQIGTNIDLARVSRTIAPKIGIADYKLDMAALLAHYAASHEDVYYAAQLSAEVSTSYLRSPMIKARFVQMWERADTSQSQMARFSELTLGNGRAIGDAITSGRASFADLLRTLDERRKFREWLVGQPFDIDLVAEYIAAVTKGSWLDRLPNKTMRWVIANAAGVGAEFIVPTGLGTATGLAISAFDAFVLERVAKGWRPDQFVNGPLERLIRGDANGI